MALVEWLEPLEDTQVVWWFGGRHWTVGDVRQRVRDCRLLFRPLAGCRVVLELQDTVDALVWMLALDGSAASVFLVPSSLTATGGYQQLKQQYGGDVTINEAQVAGWLSVPSDGYGGAVGHYDTEWVLATSGTTGIPKLVGHSASALLTTAQKNPDRGREFVWGLVFEPFRFAGLQVVLQALAGGSLLVICDPRTTIREQAEDIRRAGVNALSATPTYWRRLLFSGLLSQHHFRQITLGGEPADQSVLDALKTAFPTARIVHIYASTETGTGFSVSDGLAGFPADYLCSAATNKALAISASGTLLVGPGMIDTGDLVEVRGDRVFFKGRRSGTINVGGNKVNPEQIEGLIRQIAGVGDVVVKAKNSSVMGQLVVAEVMPWPADTNTKELRKTISDHCKRHLEPYQMPAMIRFVERINSNPAGKASRI